ncbi:hypothetical protein BRADI_1g26132v3 [Brachypodium distachyon]|uniref:Uncharacterized protein n=1 Tax=Brachypodium distachyon TaxID=15368 RepID=A0A0Q3RSF6_BRADI|nr:hypothetical protein BRADI_1g26132v3 [Brachypodium distachyon]
MSVIVRIQKNFYAFIKVRSGRLNREEGGDGNETGKGKIGHWRSLVISGRGRIELPASLRLGRTKFPAVNKVRGAGAEDEVLGKVVPVEGVSPWTLMHASSRVTPDREGGERKGGGLPQARQRDGGDQQVEPYSGAGDFASIMAVILACLLAALALAAVRYLLRRRHNLQRHGDSAGWGEKAGVLSDWRGAEQEWGGAPEQRMERRR